MVSAEEIIKKFIPEGIQNLKKVGGGDGKPQYRAEIDIIKKCMIEFAKLHTKAQKEAIVKNVKHESTAPWEEHSYNIDENSILSAYPDDLIT